MAIVKVTYTKNKTAAKKTIKYYAHRPDKHGARARRELFGPDGELSKDQAYRLIDSAQKGTTFFRIMISPDPALEDKNRDLYLPDLTVATMTKLEERTRQEIAYLAAEHNDSTDKRHLHVLAMIRGRLNPHDFRALRETATAASLFQRLERDQAREARTAQERVREEAQWNI